MFAIILSARYENNKLQLTIKIIVLEMSKQLKNETRNYCRSLVRLSLRLESRVLRSFSSLVWSYLQL